MALWKARSLSPEQKVQIVEEESETKSLQTDESGSFLGLDDVSMSEVYSCVLSVPVSYLSLSLSHSLYLPFFHERQLLVLFLYLSNQMVFHSDYLILVVVILDELLPGVF